MRQGRVALAFHALEPASITEYGEGERLALPRIGYRDEARMLDPAGLKDTLYNPFRLWLPEDSRMKLAVARATVDWIVAFHSFTLAGPGANASGLVMPYVVKWRLSGERRILQSPAAFAVPAAAIDFACTVFKQHPAEIWIEGPGGIRIERDVIFRQCQERGPLQP